jgi:sulfur carrier protein ThiS adenylyltransferase
MSEEEGRYTRQEELVPLGKLKDLVVEIIGVGAVGRQVAIQLAAMGVPKIRIIDFDEVEQVNLAPQGFREKDIGKKKVDAVAEVMTESNSEIEIQKVDGRFRKSQITQNATVFVCVDDMDVRKLIFDAYKGKCTLLVDGRMSGEVMRVFSVFDDFSAEQYDKGLFKQSDAFQGRCTARSPISTASILAGLEISMLTKLLRGSNPDMLVDFNVLTLELDVE